MCYQLDAPEYVPTINTEKRCLIFNFYFLIFNF